MYIYALKSISKKYCYIGMTGDINNRFYRHNSGLEKTTRFFRPFEIVFLTKIDRDRPTVRMVEKFFKGGSGREFIKNLK